MAYIKQSWVDYDDTKSEAQNAANGAVVTADRMNHMENGIANAAIGAPVTFAPTLLSGWVNYGDGFAPVKYWKGPDNMVHIGGLIKNGVTSEGAVLFTLPSGFRPEFKEIFTIAQDNAVGRIDVNDNGNVLVVKAGAVFTSLAGISFLAKN